MLHLQAIVPNVSKEHNSFICTVMWSRLSALLDPERRRQYDDVLIGGNYLPYSTHHHIPEDLNLRI